MECRTFLAAITVPASALAIRRANANHWRSGGAPQLALPQSLNRSLHI